MTCSSCAAVERKGVAFSSCYRCVGAPHRLCPDCKDNHHATHVVVMPGQPPMAPLQVKAPGEGAGS